MAPQDTQACRKVVQRGARGSSPREGPGRTHGMEMLHGQPLSQLMLVLWVAFGAQGGGEATRPV